MKGLGFRVQHIPERERIQSTLSDVKIFGKSKRQGHRSKGRSEVLFVEILDDKSVVTCSSWPRGI
jgi:hypothetical protein